MKDITKYFGFVTVAVSWLTLVVSGLLHSPDWSEPLSQFGVYDNTSLLFGISAIAAGVTWYLYARHLNPYWKHTSIVTFFASIFFILIGWIPYQPNSKAFVFDAHNIVVVAATILYTLPLWFIGYKKVHSQIAQISHILFFITVILVIVSVVARVLDYGVMYAQSLVLVPGHVWLVITNILLLRHEPELRGGQRGRL